MTKRANRATTQNMLAGLLVGVIVFVSAVARGNAVLAAAEAAFEKKDFATALPLLQQLAEDQKDNRSAWLEIKKRINVCKVNLTAEQFERDSWKPGMPRIEPKRDVHAPPKPDEIRTMGIKQLGNFSYDAAAGGVVPDDVKTLNGSQVRIWGFMVPLRESDNAREFALVPSPGSCCFGQPPGVQHTVTITMAAGTTAKIGVEPIWVIGMLKVEEKRADGFTSSLFEVSGATVEPYKTDGKDALRKNINLGPTENPLK